MTDERTREHAVTAGGAGGRWDRFAEELQVLRRAAGEPSFAEIARRVADQRAAAGVDEHAARVARTTVYDAFRTGRARVNVPLVREIVVALDADPALVDAWLAAPVEPVGAVPPVQPVEPVEPVAEPAAEGRVPRRTALLLLAAFVVANVLGRTFVDLFDLPIYLDMVGTAAAALALGPWYGVAVAVVTNLAGVVPSGVASIPFVLVNVAGALVWGYGVRRWGMGRTLLRFFSLNLVVAAACSLVAVPILLAMFGGSTGHGEDLIVDTFLDVTGSSVVAIAVGNLLVSLADKVISGFAALVAVSGLPPRLRAGVPLPLTPTPAGPGSAA